MIMLQGAVVVAVVEVEVAFGNVQLVGGQQGVLAQAVHDAAGQGEVAEGVAVDAVFGEKAVGQGSGIDGGSIGGFQIRRDGVGADGCDGCGIAAGDGEQ
ncbi:MAG: hypothetical protein LUF01_15565 [Bacteroides sp.]|nr:hypothetical protein [Bacteroides sp.]